VPDSTLFASELQVEVLDATLDGYQVLRQIGHGAMGIVFEARQAGVGRRVAVKVLPPHLALRSRTVKRFLREAESMGRLSHANIVDVYEVGSKERLHYFTMQYVDGPPLDRVLAVGPMAIADVIKIGIDVAGALTHAHSRGVLHRDVKPSNLLRDGERVVLTDFGLARPLDDEGAGAMTESGDLVGTPLYMSPEQIAGEGGAIDGRSDVWGLGATLYELLLQRPPFNGPNAQSILSAILNKDPQLLRKRREDVPPDLEAVLLKCLEKDVSRRYSGSAALLADLEAVQAGRQVSARPPRFFDPLLRWTRRHPIEATIAAASLVAIVVLGSNWMRSKSDLAASENLVAMEQGQRQKIEREQRIERQGMTVANAHAEIWRAHAEWEVAMREDRRAEADLAVQKIEDLKNAFPPERYLQIAVEAMRVYASMFHALDRDQEMLDYLEPQIAREPPRIALALRAGMLAGQRRYDEALVVQRERCQLDPSDPAPYLDAARVLRQLALDARRADRPWDHRRYLAQAIGLLKRVFRLAVFYLPPDVQPGDTLEFGREVLVSTLIERARVLLELGQPDAAHRDLEQALGHDSTRADARMLLTAVEASQRAQSAPPVPTLPANLSFESTARELQSAGRNLQRIYTGLRDLLRGAISEE
jgi:serine/threonine protein kinase